MSTRESLVGGRLDRWDQRLRAWELPYVAWPEWKFILVGLIVSFFSGLVAKALLQVVAALLGSTELLIPSRQQYATSFWGLVVFAPVVETIVMCVVAHYALQALSTRLAAAFVAGTVLGFMHLPGLFHFALAWPYFVAQAWFFAAFRESKGMGFWRAQVALCVWHMLHNAAVVALRTSVQPQ